MDKQTVFLLLLRRRQYAAIARRRRQIIALQRSENQLPASMLVFRMKFLQILALLCQLLLRKTKHARRGRTEWMKLRSCRWWGQARLVWNDGEWKKNFRMTKTTFLRLRADLRTVITKDDTKSRKALSVEKRVAIALWRLSGNNEYQTIAHLFGVGISTACSITNDVCGAVVPLLGPGTYKYQQVVG